MLLAHVVVVVLPLKQRLSTYSEHCPKQVTYNDDIATLSTQKHFSSSIYFPSHKLLIQIIKREQMRCIFG